MKNGGKSERSNDARRFARLIRRSRDDRGYTLLEYCAGAAVVLGVIWGSLTTMGQNVGGFLGAVGDWATRRSGELSAGR